MQMSWGFFPKWIRISSFFIGYINNAVIKLQIYFTLHMRIVRQLIKSFLSDFMYSYGTMINTNVL
jgi:hypothetical protein